MTTGCATVASWRWMRNVASCWPAGFIDHEGRLGDFKLTDGTTKSPIFRRPHSFVLLEAFKIRAGKIQQIEAVFITVPYNMPSAWE